MQNSKAYLYSVPEGVEKYEDAEVYIGQTKADLYAVKVNLSQVWNGLAPNRVNNGYLVMELEGKMTVTVKTTYELVTAYTRVRPASHGIEITFGPNPRLPANSFSIEYRR